MTTFVDTNIVIRHLTGDPPAMAVRATRFLETEDELLVADLILADAVYVLESFYQTPGDRSLNCCGPCSLSVR